MIFIDVQRISDEILFSMYDAMFLRNVLLTFKHGHDVEFLKTNFQEVFIFADESGTEELSMHLFDITFYYIRVISRLNT